MNGWTSQTDKAFYQMQYLTGHETDEMKMVLGNSQYDSHLDNQPVSRYRLLPRFVDPYGSEILTAYEFHVLVVL